jgi:hypothetical protein
MVVEINLKTGTQTIIEPMTEGNHRMAQQILGNLYDLQMRRKSAKKLAKEVNS